MLPNEHDFWSFNNAYDIPGPGSESASGQFMEFNPFEFPFDLGSLENDLGLTGFRQPEPELEPATVDPAMLFGQAPLVPGDEEMLWLFSALTTPAVQDTVPEYSPDLSERSPLEFWTDDLAAPIPSPFDTTPQEPIQETPAPPQFKNLTVEESSYGRAEDALKARFEHSNLLSPGIPFTPERVHRVKPKSLKRSRQFSHDGIMPIASSSLSLPLTPVRPTITLPRRALKARKAGPSTPLTPRQPRPTVTGFPLNTGSPMLDSDYVDDEDFQPKLKRVRKKQRVHNTPSQDSKSGKPTQIEIVMNDLPYKMSDIRRDLNGSYYCPFPNCGQSTTSEGDLGRHLESREHSTHRYVCLAVSCLEKFSREDSMKRHHNNNRGRPHKTEHERAVRQGIKHRVPKGQVDELRERVRQATRMWAKCLL
ncbi:hypothetical protein FA15DRAFT_501356 [Coprinopsis marcescibilis]|uniref:C2H2-type domain-containing protein n=1 Tax=Coprinopsis marcescibilis TaxID=230819 RepID=A0A5C3KSE7_COPMA|nr:hypothetical protein FA15DRAFT_501356 [Coprinopsis marcescibilis]